MRRELQQKSPPGPIPEPFTAQHLRQLKAGETYRYYTGNFLADIARSEQEGNVDYASMLRTVQNEAVLLEREGHIRLSEKRLQRDVSVQVKTEEEGKTVMRTFAVPMTEYYALGVG